MVDDDPVSDPFFVRDWFFRVTFAASVVVSLLNITAAVGLVRGDEWALLVSVVGWVASAALLAVTFAVKATALAAVTWFHDELGVVLERSEARALGDSLPESGAEVEQRRALLDRLEAVAAARPTVMSPPVLAAAVSGLALVVTAVIAGVVALVD